MFTLASAAAILGRFRCKQLLALGFEGAEGARLVLAHEPAIADDVGGEDCCKPTFFVLRLRRSHLPSRNVDSLTYS